MQSGCRGECGMYKFSRFRWISASPSFKVSGVHRHGILDAWRLELVLCSQLFSASFLVLFSASGVVPNLTPFDGRWSVQRSVRSMSASHSVWFVPPCIASFALPNDHC
ncbi:hypothetical protein L227DRAFT_574258 [Lentinus tigrinus ALCF2SS1-6]|uniref:Uncharacterized protein n=1 Tax=Lentinus tigrinus ALCF2SS1-6 TaxID=1328759 RepID=A0A5C2SDB2_9APHY|nr:hypothetical protein L227DRAFT_574258 [Lentinus tigrinus ALCF2SS1-6]